MKVVKDSQFFNELRKLCKFEMGMIPKRAVIQAFRNTQFDIVQSPKVLFRVDNSNEWEHVVISQNRILLSDSLENHHLSALDILKELDKLNIIKLEVEEIEND